MKTQTSVKFMIYPLKQGNSLLKQVQLSDEHLKRSRKEYEAEVADKDEDEIMESVYDPDFFN